MTRHLDREPENHASARIRPRRSRSLPPRVHPKAFHPEFTPRTWARVVTLILGTILARGQRTVAAALRQMGLQEERDFSSYHQVFNRAAWSPRRVARRLHSAVIAAFVPQGVGLTFAIDETLERRWGKKIRIRGHYRDPYSGPQILDSSGASICYGPPPFIPSRIPARWTSPGVRYASD